MTYSVQSGDTLSSIAASYGVALADLVNANLAAFPALSTNGAVSVGMTLSIPQSATSTGPRTTGVALTPQVVVSTNPLVAPTFLEANKIPILAALGALAYFWFGKKKSSRVSVAQNPSRRRKPKKSRRKSKKSASQPGNRQGNGNSPTRTKTTTANTGKSGNSPTRTSTRAVTMTVTQGAGGGDVTLTAGDKKKKNPLTRNEKRLKKIYLKKGRRKTKPMSAKYRKYLKTRKSRKRR